MIFLIDSVRHSIGKRDNCWMLGPDSAVLKTKELASDGFDYVFDYDYCKGCGLCASECPCGFIQMVDEF